jgi:uncharacterized protein (TIGR02246 family)
MKRPRHQKMLSGVVLAYVSLGLMGDSRAQETAKAPGAGAGISQRPQDETAIKQVAATFTRAFNAGDARAIAALYTEDAEIIDEFEEKIQGRPSIQEFYSAIFAERKGVTIEIALESLRFLGPDAAHETGQTRVKPAGGEPATVRDYTVLYVKQGGALAVFERPRRVPRQTGASRATQGARVDDWRVDRRKLELVDSPDLPLVGG